jgi:hypothetical protein
MINFIYAPAQRIPSMTDLVHDFKRRQLLSLPNAKWNGEKMAINQFAKALHITLSKSRLQIYCKFPVDYMALPVKPIWVNPRVGDPGHLTKEDALEHRSSISSLHDDDMKAYKRFNREKESKDCQAEAILAGMLGSDVLSDISTFDTIQDSSQRWLAKIGRIYSHWSPIHSNERNDLENLYRMCTDEHGFQFMLLIIKEYQDICKLCNLQTMSLNENKLKDILLGVQVTNRQLKTIIYNFYGNIHDANFQKVTDAAVQQILSDPMLEPGKIIPPIVNGPYFDPAVASSVPRGNSNAVIPQNHRINVMTSIRTSTPAYIPPQSFVPLSSLQMMDQNILNAAPVFCNLARLNIPLVNVCYCCGKPGHILSQCRNLACNYCGNRFKSIKDPNFHLANACPQYGIIDVVSPPPHPDVHVSTPNHPQSRRFNQRGGGRGRGRGGRGDHRARAAHTSGRSNRKRNREDDESHSHYEQPRSHRSIQFDNTPISSNAAANVHFEEDR